MNWACREHGVLGANGALVGIEDGLVGGQDGEIGIADHGGVGINGRRGEVPGFENQGGKAGEAGSGGRWSRAHSTLRCLAIVSHRLPDDVVEPEGQFGDVRIRRQVAQLVEAREHGVEMDERVIVPARRGVLLLEAQ